MAGELVAEQRRVTRLALEALEPDGFALAGSGAIREHGFIDRPTQDVDLFTVQSAQAHFSAALDRMTEQLERAGYNVVAVRRQAGFAEFEVTSSDGVQIGMDLGVDWRAEPPVRLEIGPVLACDDAVGNKVAALFSRGEVRDYLDVDAIRQTSRYSDEDLCRLAARTDAGFTPDYLARRLDWAIKILLSEVADYEVTPTQLKAVKDRLTAWAEAIRQQSRRGSALEGSYEQADSAAENRRENRDG
ncbi:MAG: nucleotidyl transferase AbiEii/AbiGii toxin family protein [Propionibacteriaceae bacterium]|jgi:hypothetical protein|nr:nucleotidyl transferase AbiEii/AbiGii toxin family protein [Propionibacteriaceae bacterium]